MSDTSLQHKTIRPGSLIGYSYYHSRQSAQPVEINSTKSYLKPLLLLLALILIGISLISFLTNHSAKLAPITNKNNSIITTTPDAIINNCQNNTLNQLIKVSISARHLWVCQGQKEILNSPVVTGVITHPDTTTPLGQYKIFNKQTNLTLTGSDTLGSWNDPISYWLPFLQNNYGQYGFHDASWRTNNSFGNIDPATDQASHGCVELPSSSAKWIYNWAQIGTTVSIVS